MTSSERATLRSYAMHMQPTTHIGKYGIADTVIKQIDEQLNCRELVKIAILRNADFSAEDVAEQIAQSVGAEVVQVMGSKITLYRLSSRENIRHLI